MDKTLSSEASLLSKIAAAGEEMIDPKKTSENPHFRSKFASLEATTEVIESVISKHGLGHQTIFAGTHIQYVVWDTDTGEKCVSSLDLGLLMGGLTGNVWQGMGQAVSYMRRYLAQAFWNLVPEDDDAQSAPSRSAAQRKPSAIAPNGVSVSDVL